MKENRLKVVLVQQSDAASSQYAVELPSLAFQTFVCRTVNTFRRVEEQHGIVAAVLVGPCQGVSQLVPLLRRINADMWLVYVGAGSARQHRIEALVSGVDVCLPEAVDTSELASLLHALIRRGQTGRAISHPSQHGASIERRTSPSISSLPPPGVQSGATPFVAGPTARCLTAAAHAGSDSRPVGCDPSTDLPPEVLAAADAAGPLASWLDGLKRGALIPDGWRLAEGGRRLVDPTGRAMPLTPSERIFMAHMLQSGGRPVHRVVIAAAEEGGASAGVARSVDVLVSRLRRKADRHGISLPVLAVRRWGYMFVAEPPALRHPQLGRAQLRRSQAT